LPPVHIPTEKSAALAQNTGQSGMRAACDNSVRAAVSVLTDRVARHAAAEKHSFGGNAEVYEWEQDEISKYAYDGGAAKTAESKTPQKSLAQKKFVLSPHPPILNFPSTPACACLTHRLLLQTPPDARLEKVDKSGMKTLTSFFAVKKKE
jgi:hypothetical protein